MIKANETTNRSLKIKDVYMDDNKIIDEDGNGVDIYGLLQNVFGEGAVFTITAGAKADRELDY